MLESTSNPSSVREWKMTANYTELRTAVEAAGFYVTKVAPFRAHDRVVVCGEKRSDGHGYTGNSFWVSQIAGDWYLGSWSGREYALPHNANVALFCITVLTRSASKTEWDFDEQLKRDFGIVELEDSDFEQIAGST